MLTTQEIRQLGNKEMMDELQKSRRELLKTQFDTRGGTSKEIHMLKNLRRYIAKLQTIAREMNVNAPVKKAETAAAPAVETVSKAPAPVKKAAAPKKAAAKTAKAPAKKAPAAPKSAKK